MLRITFCLFVSILVVVDYLFAIFFVGAEVNLDEKCMCAQQLCVDFKRASEGETRMELY